MESTEIKMIINPFPTALVYGFDNTIGERELSSYIPWNDPHEGKALGIFRPSDANFNKDLAKYKPNLIITIGNLYDYPNVFEATNQNIIATKSIHFDDKPELSYLGTCVYEASCHADCEKIRRVYQNKETPMISAFTGAFCTSKKEIERLYNSLKNQTYAHWEWVIVDDSPEDYSKTRAHFEKIAMIDDRLKYHRILPATGGGIGEVKFRAAKLCNGKYLAEIDHDDELMPSCFEEVVNGFKKYPDAGFLYSDHAEPIDVDKGEYITYSKIGEKRGGSHGYAYHDWVEIDGKKYLQHHFVDINPRTIRYNYCMPNHIRVWDKDLYNKIGGHNRLIPMGDDFEIILRTFLETKFIHIKKLLYLQHTDNTNTTQYRVGDINKRSRIYRDIYGERIHNRIKELGFVDWDWDDNNNCSYASSQEDHLKFNEEEGVMNYTIS